MSSAEIIRLTSSIGLKKSSSRLAKLKIIRIY